MIRVLADSGRRDVSAGAGRDRALARGDTVFAMIRNIGAGAGISVILAWMIRDNAAIQSHLVETVTLDNPLVNWRMPQFDPLDPVSATGMVGQIMRQVAMVGYVLARRGLGAEAGPDQRQ